MLKNSLLLSLGLFLSLSHPLPSVSTTPSAPDIKAGKKITCKIVPFVMVKEELAMV